jgi:glycosyltransferase involved in cell wall biosynthesis
MIGLYREQRRRRSSLSAFRKVLVASHHMADEYRRHGVEDERLGLVPLFPPDMTPDPLAPKAAAKSSRIVFIGRVNRLKGVFHLLEALPRAAATLGRKLHLVVCGDGPDRAEAEAAARASGLAVDFLGWVNAASRTDEMRRAELLAVPSVWPEPFGLVGLEAGCVGLPAVGFATGGIPDWLVPGVSGESAPGHRPNPSELADAVVRALADDTHRHRLAVGAWETARRFTAEAHFSQLSQLLRSIPEQLPSSRRPQTLGRS